MGRDLTNSESILHQDAWNVISSHEIFKHGGSSMQFTVFSIQRLNKGRKGFIVSTSDNRNYTNWMSNCHKCYTNVTQMLANRLQGSFIPQIKRIPPSNDISFNLLWIKCQCSYAIVLWDFCNGIPHSYIEFWTKRKKP